MSSDQAFEKYIRDLVDIGGGPQGVASLLFHEAAMTPPERFMHLVPEDVQIVMREQSANSPATIEDLHWTESSNYRAEFFRGLTEAEIACKIADDKNSRKQRWLDGVRAVLRYFAAH